MSKRRRKKHFPNKPCVPRVLAVSDSDSMVKEHVVDNTRRNLIVGGTAAAVLVAVGYGVFREDEDAPILQKGPEYNEWASKIELPEIRISDKPLEWNSEKIDEYFLPNNIDRKKLKKFYRVFDKEINKLRKILSKEKYPKQRGIQIATFHLNVITAYKEMVGDKTHIQSENELRKFLNIMNPLLVSHGVWMEQGSHPDEGPGLKVFKVGGVHDLEVQVGDSSRVIPVVFHKEAEDFPVLPNKKPVQLVGRYQSVGDYIVIDPVHNGAVFSHKLEKLSDICKREGIEVPDIEVEKGIEGGLKSALFHEGMHGVFDKVMGVAPYGKSVQKKGAINMGNYNLEEKDYMDFDNFALHELAGFGYGLMNAGKTAKIDVFNMVSDNSRSQLALLRKVLIAEITHSKSVDKELSEKLKTMDGKSDLILYLKAFMQIPDEEFHKIGERMVKLAIYLTKK